MGERWMAGSPSVRSQNSQFGAVSLLSFVTVFHCLRSGDAVAGPRHVLPGPRMVVPRGDAQYASFRWCQPGDAVCY
jgi:hypothetical protein